MAYNSENKWCRHIRIGFLREKWVWEAKCAYFQDIYFALYFQMFKETGKPNEKKDDPVSNFGED